MMKKKILSALTALCCAVGCFSLPASAFDLSEIDMGENTTILAETETFVYLSDGRIYTSMIDTHDLFLVTGTYYQENGTEPYYYIFNPIYNGYFGDEVLIYADEVKAQLTEGSAMPQYGDLLDCDYSIITETYPTSIGFSASSGCIDNLGASVDVLGTDFQCVVSHNMCTDIIWNDADGNPCEFRINPVLPNEEFIVIGVDNEENPEKFVIMSMDTMEVLRFDDRFLQEGESSVAFGDILLLEGNMICTEEAGLNTFSFVDEEGNVNDNAGCAYNTGSVLNNETAVFTAGEAYWGLYRCLDDYWYYMMEDGFTQPGCIDLATVSSGDSVTCITYNGVPVLPVAVNAEADASLVTENIPYEELTEDELIELKKYYVVLDVPDENGESYYAISRVYTNSYCDLSLPMEFIDENNKPQQGDLIWLENYYDVETIPATIYPFYDGTFNFINFGSAENYLKTQSFNVTFDCATECSTNAYILQDESGTVSYEFPDCGKFVPETTVEFLMYDDEPIYPLSTSSLGDFNTDGEINTMDATRILMAAAAAGAGTETVSTASETPASPVGDVNSDGEVNAMDATIVLVYAARNGAGEQISVSEVAAELMS